MDLGERAKQILTRRVAPYTSPRSTVFRIFEMYERIPQPTFAAPAPSKHK